MRLTPSPFARDGRPGRFTRTSTEGGGGGTDDLDTDVIDSEDTDDQDDDAGADNDDPQPFVKEDGSVFTAADYDALQTALRAARKEAREARKGKGATEDKPDAGKDGDGTDVERARLAAEQAATAAWKPLVVNQAARAQLTSAGLIGAPDRLLRLIDLDDIDVDPTTGAVDGLAEQVADLKRDYPHLFKRRAGKLDAADDPTKKRSSKPMTATERQAAVLRGEA